MGGLTHHPNQRFYPMAMGFGMEWREYILILNESKIIVEDSFFAHTLGVLKGLGLDGGPLGL